MRAPLPIHEIAGLTESAASLRGRRILVAGSGGFLGRWITEALRPIAEVVELDIATGFDIADQRQIAELASPVDCIVHAAGYASPRAYRANPLATIAVSVDGTRNLLDLAVRHRARLLYFSSSEIYGNPNVVPTPEGDPGSVSCRGPRACYDEGKRLGETLCQIYYDLQGAQAVTVRPFNVYGPGMALDDGRVIARFARQIGDNEPNLVYGGGRPTRTYCYVSDAIAGCLAALQFGQAGRVYNIGIEAPEISAAGLAGMMRAVANIPGEVVCDTYPQDYPGDEPQRRCPDISRARAELGYQPAIGLGEGLRRYLEWAGLL